MLPGFEAAAKPGVAAATSEEKAGKNGKLLLKLAVFRSEHNDGADGFNYVQIVSG